MINRSKVRYSKLALGLAIALALASAPAFAQNTTANIGGRVTAADQAAISGATVSITHLPSGTTAQAVSDANGRYAARGLRVGGPYRVTITKDGKTETIDNVFLQLAETTQVDASIGAPAAETTLDTVEVTAANVGYSPFSSTAVGAGTTVTREQLDTFASIQRDLQDYARLDPRISQTDKERGEISAGGQNSRFNSITIDGVNTSDTFGLEANNLPTAKQPISIDAIEEVQINISNYDVTQRGYTGANINAVTKSGTNDFRGSVYYVFRDDSMAGDRFSRGSGLYTPAPESEDITTGFTLGGPILKDRLFFFASAENYTSTRIAPDFGPIGSSSSNIVQLTTQNIQDTIDLARSRYSMDIGSLEAPEGAELNVKDRLLKLDWNIAENHRASLRYNETNESTPIFPGSGGSSLALNSHWYSQAKTFDGIVGQWFADWSDVFSTELKMSRRTYDSQPINNANLPMVNVRFRTGTPSAIRNVIFGTERSRHFNVLGTETDNLYFGGNLFLGDHELKFGVDYETNSVFNAFLQDTRGNYTFDCLLAAQCANSFEAGRPLIYAVQQPLAGRTLNDGVAQWDIENLGLFFQDTWAVNYNLTIVAGIRGDITGMPDSPLFNPAASSAVGPTINTPLTGGGFRPRVSGGFGLDNSSTLDGEVLWQPRVGFNYTFDSDRQTQLRGGFGLFQGSAANVWLSNPYSNTGAATGIVGCGGTGQAACPTNGTLQFSPNPASQPGIAGSPPAPNVDFLDENLDQPSVWKANLAFEHELPWWGAIFSAEAILTKVEDAVFYQHLNLGAPTATGNDGRQLFWSPGGYNTACWGNTGAVQNSGVCAPQQAQAVTRWGNNAQYFNVTKATPTKKGGGENFTISLFRPRQDDNWSWSLGYSYTDATEVSPLTSAVANSSWQARAVFNPNEEIEATSPYVVRDRFVGTLSYRHFFFDGYATDFGLFYEGRAGKPYSWLYSNDLNGDGSTNDLMYIPTALGSGDVVFRGGATEEAAFWSIINRLGLSRYAGSVVDRYSDRAPWTNSFDMRVSQQFPGFMDGHKSELVLDILNVGNLINKEWGRVDEIGFQAQGAQARSFVNYLGRDAQGRYIYGLDTRGVEDFLTRNSRGESAWAAQVTFRYRF